MITNGKVGLCTQNIALETYTITQCENKMLHINIKNIYSEHTLTHYNIAHK